MSKAAIGLRIEDLGPTFDRRFWGKVQAPMTGCYEYPKANLSDNQVRQIRKRRADGESCAHLGREYGVSHQLVSQISRYLSRRHS